MTACIFTGATLC